MHNEASGHLCRDDGAIGRLLPAGEMVVDEEEMDGSKQRRRFLIYDVMLLGGEGVADLRFAVRIAGMLSASDRCLQDEESKEFDLMPHVNL
jgi:hypothetical protein